MPNSSPFGHPKVYFSTVYAEGKLTHLLSFFFLAATVILWFELLEQYPPKTSSVKLRLFETALTMAVLFLLASWLFIYWDFWKQMVVAVIFGVLSLIVTGLFQKYDLFNRLFATRAGGRWLLRRVVYFFTLGVILAATLLLATIVGIKVTPWLDQLKARVEQIR
ncbi:MAG TPA: hypothetical protein VK573_08880 [Gemmatimonadales bacterium]|nr:hypothetical protein [Gemmatimonadales bacterium]